MIKLTNSQIARIEEMLNRNEYVLNDYIQTMIAEDFEEIHDGAKPDIVDALGCVFCGDSRYREDRRHTFFKIEDSPKYGIDFSILCSNCYHMSKETYEEVEKITMAVLNDLKENYME